MDDLRARAWKLQCDIQSMGENDQREIIEHAFRAAVEAEREHATDVIARILCWNNGIAECADHCGSFQGCQHGMRDFGDKARAAIRGRTDK